jgi:hypothetical protein
MLIGRLYSLGLLRLAGVAIAGFNLGRIVPGDFSAILLLFGLPVAFVGGVRTLWSP